MDDLAEVNRALVEHIRGRMPRSHGARVQRRLCRISGPGYSQATSKPGLTKGTSFGHKYGIRL